MVWRRWRRPRTEARARRQDGHSRGLTPDGPLRKTGLFTTLRYPARAVVPLPPGPLRQEELYVGAGSLWRASASGISSKPVPVARMQLTPEGAVRAIVQVPAALAANIVTSTPSSLTPRAMGISSNCFLRNEASSSVGIQEGYMPGGSCASGGPVAVPTSSKADTVASKVGRGMMASLQPASARSHHRRPERAVTHQHSQSWDTNLQRPALTIAAGHAACRNVVNNRKRQKHPINDRMQKLRPSGTSLALTAAQGRSSLRWSRPSPPWNGGSPHGTADPTSTGSDRVADRRGANRCSTEAWSRSR